MLKIAIENSYTDTYSGKDEYGAKLFMQDFFKKNGIQLVRVSINKLNKNNTFTEYNILADDGKTRTIKKSYRPDIIRSRRGIGTFYKYSRLEESYTIIPSKKIAIISNDKYETYLFCKQYQPKTILLSSFLAKKNKALLAKNIVIKPLRANGGKGIELTTTDALYQNKDAFLGVEELYIVQEFKDFSGGIPGITTGYHDIRLMFAGKKIIETTLRIPKKGNFKSNIGSGGTQSPLSKKQIPKDLWNLAKKIYNMLHLTGEDIFSMDFGYCKKEKRWYIIEINASPGTRYYQTDKTELEKICMGLIGFFTSFKR